MHCSYFALHDTNVDTGGEFKNECNDPLHTDIRRPEKQGSFLCRALASIGESRVERIRHQCQCFLYSWHYQLKLAYVAGFRVKLPMSMASILSGGEGGRPYGAMV